MIEKLQSTLRAAFGNERICVHDEKGFQDLVQTKLEKLQIPFTREHRLGPKKRPDFLVQGIAIELKIKAAGFNLLRQLKRYADDSTIAGVLLVTTRASNVPDELNGKPVRVIELWKNLL